MLDCCTRIWLLLRDTGFPSRTELERKDDGCRIILLPLFFILTFGIHAVDDWSETMTPNTALEPTATAL